LLPDLHQPAALADLEVAARAGFAFGSAVAGNPPGFAFGSAVAGNPPSFAFGSAVAGNPPGSAESSAVAGIPPLDFARDCAINACSRSARLHPS
jgi:hypothetical protein